MRLPNFVIRWARRACGYGDLARAYGELFTVMIRLKGEMAHAKPVPWRRRTPHAFRDTVALPEQVQCRRESAVFNPADAAITNQDAHSARRDVP